MAMDRVTETLLTALKQALADQGEHSLYRAGKAAGLFPARSGPSGDAAAAALRDGLLELTRTEVRGKTTIEWVRITPRGVNWVHEQEAPIEVLRELRSALQTTRQGVPLWLADIRLELQEMEKQLTGRVQRYLQWLDALQERVDVTLKRLEKAGPELPESLTRQAPWAAEALAYLERREASGAQGPCPLPELFAALREKHAELSLPDFHDGLRRLHQRRALHLLPPPDAGQPLPEPEHALVDGDGVFYYAVR